MEKDKKSEKIKMFLITNYKWIVFVICIVVLLFIIKNVLSKDILLLDEAGYERVSKYLISDTVTPFAKVITYLSSPYWLVFFSAVLALFFLKKNKKISAYIIVNLGLVAVLNFILKHIMQRPRPEGYRLVAEKGYSFPSGHSMIGIAFYGFLIYLIHKNIKNKALKIILTVILAIIILSIGISRIYLGVHYTSDVLAGFLTGLAFLILFVHVIKIEKGGDKN